MKKVSSFLILVGSLSLLLASLYSYQMAEEEKAAAQSAQTLVTKIKSEKQNLDHTAGFSIEGKEYMALLTFPALSIELPVQTQWSGNDEDLITSPVRQFGSSSEDNLVIAGHNYDQHFGRLKDLESGDEVYLTSPDNQPLTYQVVKIEVLNPEETERMKNSSYDLTLYTCTYGGSQRVTIRCQRIE